MKHRLHTILLFTLVFSVMLRPQILFPFQTTQSPDWLTPLRADFNHNGSVDFADFLLFIDHYGTQTATYDLSNSGSVGFGDFLEFVSDFGKTQKEIPITPTPLYETPGALHIIYTPSDKLTYSFIVGDTTTSTARIESGIQGDTIEVRVIGTDAKGDQVEGGVASVYMPIHYYNGVIGVGETVEFSLPDPLPTKVWLYGEMDVKDAIFRATITNGQAARRADIDAGNGKGYDKTDIETSLVAGKNTLLLRGTDGGNITRFVISDSDLMISF